MAKRYTVCNVCREEAVCAQIKAGCGCLVDICDECHKDDSAHLTHSKCIVCRGGKRYDTEEGLFEPLSGSMYDLIDDDDFNFDHCQEEDDIDDEGSCFDDGDYPGSYDME